LLRDGEHRGEMAFFVPSAPDVQPPALGGLEGQQKILNVHFRTDVCIATASFRICFRNGTSSGCLMGLSGSPSLLAFAALVGFVLVQAVLKFAF
jgi:hypothetical protein